MNATMRMKVARVLLWVAVSMAVAAQFMPFRSMRMYELWSEVVSAVRWMIRAGMGSPGKHLPMLCFIVGSFGVAAAPWCVRALHLNALLRWIARVMSVTAWVGFALWLRNIQLREPYGCMLLATAMAVSAAGLFLIPGSKNEQSGTDSGCVVPDGT